MNLIVTPEYLKRLHDDHPDVHVHVLRVDWGVRARNFGDGAWAALGRRIWPQ